jgi:hypothetical protein
VGNGRCSEQSNIQRLWGINMATNYTVIYTHPSGGTATFIYEDGELSSLAKGLDAEQFWVFKQVKALLLRNDEGDLALASGMMAEHGFTAQVTQPLPTLLTSPDALRGRPSPATRTVPSVHYRRPPGESFAIFQRAGHSHGEVHWRENGQVVVLAPHRTPTPPTADGTAKTPQSEEWSQNHNASHHGEVHWREG